MVTVDELIGAWNSTGFVRVQVFHSARKAQLMARNREPFFRAHWREALEIAVGKRFCHGDNERNWRATVDWFLRPATVPRLIEDEKYLESPSKAPNLTETRRERYEKEWAERRKEFAAAVPFSEAQAILRQARKEGRA